MLKSFLIVKPADQRSTDVSASAAAEMPQRKTLLQPETAISQLGLRAHISRNENAAKEWAAKSDAVILCVGIEHIEAWAKRASSWRSWPILWWNDGIKHAEGCLTHLDVDGILFPHMSKDEFHWSLLLGSSHYLRRTQWQKEREQLLERMEERKWIERAKAVLCEIKQISEAEAYDFLRKQAMNERKRMIDVASSIVKVYQLINDNKQGGRRT